MKFTVNTLLTCIQVQYVDSSHGYHICPHMFFFGDVGALLRESYTFV